MSRFIKIIELSVLIYLIWAAVTAGLITLSGGETVSYQWKIGWMKIGHSISGIQGEADYNVWLYIAAALNRILFLYAFYRLWCLFRSFAKKAFFAQKTIAHLRAFTGLFTLFVISRLGIEFIHYMSLPYETRGYLDTSEIGTLSYPILFFIIAYILNEARKNVEELDSYF